MTALSRQQVKIFASNALSSQVTAFRTTEEESPTFSKTPDVLQSEKYVTGWLNADNTGNVAPHVEDFNGLFLTSSYLTAYLYEKGIPEYLATQTYYINSFCQYQGKLYRCKVDNTVNYLPTDTDKWDELAISAYTASNIGTGDYSIYAGTNAAGTEFQFKKLIAGTNVTMLETDDSLTINSTQGTASFTANSPLSYSDGVLSISQASSSANGYLSSADWTSFNSKLSSTIFSANNSWTGTNTFSAITLGVNDLATTLGEKQDKITSSNKLSTSLLNINSNLVPTGSYDLGSNSFPFNDLFIDLITAGNLHIANSSSYNNQICCFYPVTGNWVYFTGGIPNNAGGGFTPSDDNKLSLGQSTLRWANLYSKQVSLGSGSAYISNNRESDDLIFTWKYANNTRQISLYHDYVLPENNNTINIGGTNNRWATIYYTTLNPSSDIRLKENIEPLENGLAKINSLDVKSFTFKNKSDHIEYGIIAQDTVNDNPELISVPDDESGYYGIYLHNFVFLAVKAIQELSAKVTVLENKLESINGN